MPGIKELNEFIDYAENNRKYAQQTAKGRRVALKIFEADLNDEEKKSVDLIEARFTQIYNSVFQRNKLKIKAPTLETYKVRVLSLIRDFKKYGTEPAAFTNWDSTKKRDNKTGTNQPLIPTAATRRNIDAEIVEPDDSNFDEEKIRQIATAARENMFPSEINKVEIHLRPSFKISLVLPTDLTEHEAKRLKQIIDGMVVGDESNGV